MNVKRIARFSLEAAALIVSKSHEYVNRENINLNFRLVFVFWRIEDWIIPHTKRGFFCGDVSLSYPYKVASIPTEWLDISVYVVPILVSDHLL